MFSQRRSSWTQTSPSWFMPHVSEGKRPELRVPSGCWGMALCRAPAGTQQSCAETSRTKMLRNQKFTLYIELLHTYFFFVLDCVHCQCSPCTLTPGCPWGTGVGERGLSVHSWSLQGCTTDVFLYMVQLRSSVCHHTQPALLLCCCEQDSACPDTQLKYTRKTMDKKLQFQCNCFNFTLICDIPDIQQLPRMLGLGFCLFQRRQQ